MCRASKEVSVHITFLRLNVSFWISVLAIYGISTGVRVVVGLLRYPGGGQIVVRGVIACRDS